MLVVGDAITSSMHKRSLEFATNTILKTAKASTAFDCNESQPLQRTFKQVVIDELEDDNHDILVIQAGAKNISNLPNDCSHGEISELKEKVVKSAKNLIELAEKATSDNPNLKKVVIAKQIPRYDKFVTKPPGLKTSLSHLFNATLDQLGAKSDLKNKLFIGEHTIACDGAQREARYRDTKTGRYNGVHLFGPSGTKAYTESLLIILKKAELVKNHVPKYYDEIEKSSKVSKKKQNVSKQSYAVPTYNRFSTLADYFPGNF